MTSSKLLLPLRVPELGPHLGRLVTGTGRDPGGLGFDTARYRLVTRLLEAAGEARRLAQRDEREAALAAVGRAIWLTAWEEAVHAVAELVTRRVATHLEAEAAAARMPGRLRRRVVLDPAEARALAARLGSAGADLVPALDALEARAAAARPATPRERAAVAAWQDALTTAARRLEAAWLALEDAVEAEVARWREVSDAIARWRRPWWPVLVVGTAALALAVWLGLVLGGYLPVPRALADWWPRAVLQGPAR